MDQNWKLEVRSRKQLFLLLPDSFLWGPGNFTLVKTSEIRDAENPTLRAKL